MNKNECKKYLKRACDNLRIQNKDITLRTLEIEIKKEVDKEVDLYIAYIKIALDFLKSSANKITDKDLIEEIDILPKIYSEKEIVEKSEKIKT